MDDKSAYEAYRVKQFASPHPAAQAQSNPWGLAGGLEQELVGIEADRDRVIIHFDVDAFYAQVTSAKCP